MRILSLDERDGISSCSRQLGLLNENLEIPIICEAYTLSLAMHIPIAPKACVEL